MRRRDLLLVSGAILIAAVAMAVVLYGPSLSFDLFWDDYGSLRPRSWPELFSVWHGTWAPSPADVWPRFYRPLAIWYYNAAFQLFGLNARPLHVISLVEIAIAGGVVGVFVWREIQSFWVGVFSAALYVAFPPMAFAEGPWFSNQFHIVVTFCVVAALFAWQRARIANAFTPWALLFLALVVGFLVKEDTLMMAPAIVTVQLLRSRLVGDTPAPTIKVTGVMVAGCVALIAFRAWCLGGMGGYFPPYLPDVAGNLIRGPLRVLGILPIYRTAIVIGAVLTWIAIGTGTVAAWRHPKSNAMKLWLTGATLFAFANLPLALMSNLSRYHLLGLGAVLLIASGAAAVGRGAWRYGVAFATGLGLLVPAHRLAQEEYRPCTSSNLERDQDILAWNVMPAELQTWLEQKPARCAAGTFAPLTDSIAYVGWESLEAEAIAGVPTDSGLRLPTVLLVRQPAHTLTFTISSRSAAANHPVHVRWTANATKSGTIDLTSPQSGTISVPLEANFVSHLRRMHRIDLSVPSKGVAADVVVRDVQIK